METQLDRVAASYDQAIDLGRRGIDLYEDLPKKITEDPGYPLYRKMKLDGTLSDSGRPQIRSFLSPQKGMRFVDLGCCLNFMFRGCQDWPCSYYGLDISEKTIKLLEEYCQKENRTDASFYCGSMHSTPFADAFFELGACIGSLEYFKRDFVRLAAAELHRILKPGGRAVLDIPLVGSPEFQIAAQIEAHLGREDQFDLSVEAFEELLHPYFQTKSKERVGPMLQYFLVRQ